MRALPAFVLAIALGAPGSALPMQAQPAASHVDARMTTIRHDASAPTRINVATLALAPTRVSTQRVPIHTSSPKTRPRPGTPEPTLVLGPTTGFAAGPALATGPALPLISTGFAGMDDTVNAVISGCPATPRPCLEPPDPWVAAGPSTIVQSVNIAFRMTDRSGGGAGTVPLSTFFSEPGGQIGNGDARVLYDASKNRWIASELSYDCAAGRLYLATSDGADPTGTWTVWNFTFAGAVPDYPGIGMSADKVLLGVNLFPINPDASPAGCSIGSFMGASLLVVDWADMADGGALAGVEVGPTSTLFTWRPAVAQAPDTTAHAIVEDQQFGNADLGMATITGTVAGADVTVATYRNLTAEGLASDFQMPPAPRQPGSPSTIAAATDGRPTDAVWRAGRLWLTSTSPCLIDIIRACVHLVELDTIDPAAVNPVVQDTLLGQEGFDSYLPGIALADNGTAFVTYTRSSTYAPAGIQAVYKAVGDPEYRGWHEIKPGAGTYNGRRWGDYAGMSPDPSVPGAVWQGHQYANAAGGWSTWVSQLSTGSVGTPGTVVRLSGPDRYATAAAVSAATFSRGVPVAYVATGANYPDALAGGAAAAYLNSPLVLVTRDTIPGATAGELARLNPGRVVALGGPTVISDAVLGALGSYTTGTATRLAGTDRYATAAAISAATFASGVAATFIAVGTNYPDALAGGPAAGLFDSPLLLVTRDTIPTATAAELARLKPALIYVLGGTSVVSDAVASALGPYSVLGAPGVRRLSGPDRYATAAAISAALFAPNVSTVYVATGANYPDALAGGPAATFEDGPLLLVTYGSIPAATATELIRLSPGRIVVLGGASVISDSVFAALSAYVAP